MTSRDFCYWLQGCFEITNPQELSPRETTLIKQHLKLVFTHEIDPSIPDPTGVLQAIHDGKPPFQAKPPFQPPTSFGGVQRC
jgi:hypothetical protein